MKAKLESIIKLMSETGILEEQVQGAFELSRRYSEKELIVSVIGQFKRGKSSLINAMLGEDILPVGIIPLTTVVTEIRHGGSFRAVVSFTDGPEREIPREELPEYVSEQQNRDNHKKVAAVKLWTERELFGKGVVLVDTPGVGSVHQHNTETSHSYIEKSDAVLFLLSVDSPVSETEREFLLKTREHASKFYFAVNKIDTISRENLAEFISYCGRLLSESVGFEAVLYPVSAKTGEGISEIVKRISEDIRASYEELLSSSIDFKLDNIISQAKSKMHLYLKAASIPAEELESRVGEIMKKQASLELLSDEVQVLARKQAERLVGRIEERINAMLPELLAGVRASAQSRYETLKALPSRQFEQKMLAELETLLREEVGRINDAGLLMLEEGYSDIVGSLNKKAADTAMYLSDMVREYFGIEYPVSSKEFAVSARDDYFFRMSRGGSIYLDADRLTHLLPKAKANEKIFERALKKAMDDLELNKNNILYNYRYKMQESLRPLCREFSEDITKMSAELIRLLKRLEKDHKTESEGFDRIKNRFAEIMRQMDCSG